MARPRAWRLMGTASASARANRNRSEAAALAEEGRAGKYPTDVLFAPEAPIRRTHEGPPPRQRVGEIRELAGQNKSQLEIAILLDMALTTVSRLMKRHGIKKGQAA